MEGAVLKAVAAVSEPKFYIPATGPGTRPRRTLKHNDTFIVLDSHGDIGASAGGPDGLFAGRSEIISGIFQAIEATQPVFHSSAGSRQALGVPMLMNCLLVEMIQRMAKLAGHCERSCV